MASPIRFTITDIHLWHDEGAVNITALTDIPCSLTLHLALQDPLIEPAAKLRRGATWLWHDRIRFIQNAQYQEDIPGDSHLHYFTIPIWETGSLAWWYFRATVAGVPSVSNTPLFYLAEDTAEMAWNVNIADYLFDSLDSYDCHTTGTGTIQLDSDALRLTVPQATIGTARTQVAWRGWGHLHYWRPSRLRIIGGMYIYPETNYQFWLGIGRPDHPGPGYGFFADGPQLYLYSRTDTGWFTAPMGPPGLPAGYKVLEARNYPGQNLVGFCDGQPLATITYNNPTGTGQGLYIALTANNPPLNAILQVYRAQVFNADWFPWS